jgi:hypothetical protein
VAAGKVKLTDTQIAALHCAAAAGCLFGEIGVGHGKTLIGAMLPDAIRARRPLLLVPGSLYRATLAERAKYGVIRRCTVWTYEMVGHPSHRFDLDALSPDLLILDEAHEAVGKGARKHRIAEYIQTHNPSVCAISGTMLHPITRAAMLGQWVWGDTSPLPHTRKQALELERVIRGDNTRDLYKWARIYGTTKIAAALPGIVHSVPGGFVATGMSCAASIEIERIEWRQPLTIRNAIRDLESSWSIGETLFADALQVARARRQLAQGFCYRYTQPLNRDWLSARQEWSAACRSFLARPKEIDSEGLIVQACRRGAAPNAALRNAWTKWEGHRKTKLPPTESVWVDTTRVQLAEYIAKQRDALLWHEFTAPAEIGSLPWYAPKQTPEGEAAWVSVFAHARGLNLQHYREAVMLAPLSNPDRMEQLLGRIHRLGQSADSVRLACIVCETTNQDLDTAIARAHTEKCAARLQIASESVTLA